MNPASRLVLWLLPQTRSNLTCTQRTLSTVTPPMCQMYNHLEWLRLQGTVLIHTAQELLSYSKDEENVIEEVCAQ